MIDSTHDFLIINKFKIESESYSFIIRRVLRSTFFLSILK